MYIVCKCTIHFFMACVVNILDLCPLELIVSVHIQLYAFVVRITSPNLSFNLDCHFCDKALVMKLNFM